MEPWIRIAGLIFKGLYHLGAFDGAIKRIQNLGSNNRTKSNKSTQNNLKSNNDDWLNWTKEDWKKWSESKKNQYF